MQAGTPGRSQAGPYTLMCPELGCRPRWVLGDNQSAPKALASISPQPEAQLSLHGCKAQKQDMGCVSGDRGTIYTRAQPAPRGATVPSKGSIWSSCTKAPGPLCGSQQGPEGAASGVE